jgi:cytochrome c oxidase subunit 3
MITGFHGTHVTIGVIFLIATRKVWRATSTSKGAAFSMSRKGRDRRNHRPVLVLVDLVWVFIFAFFYLW